MNASLQTACNVALRIQAEKFPDADCVMLCGSVARGSATPTSDLDLVLLHDHVDYAWRESFEFESFPVECFCHDAETAEFYFTESDRPSGIGSLMHMVLDGIVLPHPTPLSRQVKARAQALFEQGPSPWTQKELDYSRYTISGLMDDLRGARASAELVAIGTVLYAMLAHHLFRSRNRWSAHGKLVLPRLQQLDVELAGRYERAFASLFGSGERDALIDLCEHVLAPDGGYLFAGYHVLTDAAQRKPAS